MEGIRQLEHYSAPLLVGLTAALLAWAGAAAGGFGPMLAAPSAFAAGGPRAGAFWAAFLPALSAQVAAPGCTQPPRLARAGAVRPGRPPLPPASAPCRLGTGPPCA